MILDQFNEEENINYIKEGKNKSIDVSIQLFTKFLKIHHY